jgi:phosphoglycolate phosphatase
MAVVTSKLEATAVAIIESLGIRRHFQTIAGGTIPPEPKAVSLGRALVTLGWAAGSCWIVGDRRHDVEAGKACGIGTIGVTWGIGDEDELRLAGADVIVSTPEALAEFLVGVAESADA